MTDDRDRSVYATSNQVFALAQEAVASGDLSASEAQARELNATLDEQWESLSADPSPDPGVQQAWSDARLELGYVLSGGELSPSARLDQFLRSR